VSGKSAEYGTRTFSVPASWVSTVSSRFEDAFRDMMREGDDGEMELSDVDILTFEVFDRWLSGCILIHESGRSYADVASDGNQGTTLAYKTLLDVYIFSVKYNIPQLRRDVVNAFMQVIPKAGGVPDVDIVSRAYEVLAEDDPLIKLLVNAYVRHFIFQTSKMELIKRFPKQFLVEVLCLIDTEEGDAENPLDHPCDYHEH
jgi:hypothetical protein